MSAQNASDSSFDVYIDPIAGSRGRQRPPAPEAGARPAHASHRRTRQQRDRTAARIKRKAAEFLAQAGDLRKLVARLSAPENLMSATVFTYFECLIPRLHSIARITDRVRQGIKAGRLPSGIAGFDFLLRVVKNLTRQIESALAVASLEAHRCRRRPALFDLHRLVEEACRDGQSYYLAGEVGLTVNPSAQRLRIRGKRALWHLVLVDLVCRAEEFSPRRGLATRVTPREDGSARLAILPRGALLSADESAARARRQAFLGRTSPDLDPAFALTLAIIGHLGGRLAVGQVHRACILPLFTLDIPALP
ncbi:MAG: hypothetical protein JXQ29_06230 [Planctomycetes bacterium]|nr:hypothetical protein [Planctomycetota bacterium]